MRWSKALQCYKKNIVVEKTFKNKTGREIKFLLGQCSSCKRKKSMIVSDNTIQAKDLGSFFKNLGRISAKDGEKIATNVLKNPGRALEIGVNVATAAASRNRKAALTTMPEVVKFYHKGEGLYLGKFVKILLYKWNKKTDRLYPSAPLIENIDLEQRLKKKLKDVNSCNNHINNIKETITYIKDKENKSKKKYQKRKQNLQ